MTQLEKIGVVGAGQMGQGIAQVAAQEASLPVILLDVSAVQLEKAKSNIEKNLDKLLEKAIITAEQKTATLKNISFESDLKKLSDCDIIIEAAPENLDLKKSLFTQLDSIAKPEAILASNTSSISLTVLASITNRPSQVIGMHFMNPVPRMPLVEIIRAHQTTDAVYQKVDALAQKMKKTTTVSEDYPGFLANRILMPMLNEAIFALYEGVGSKEDIDTTMKLGMNHPMGPLQLADFIGLDTCLAILNVLHDGFKDPKYRPCPLLVKMVDAGLYGKKSGEGFYKY